MKKEYMEKAEEISKTITIRTYDNGNSVDTTRESTPEEKEIIFRLAYSAFLAYNFSGGKDENGIFNMAEFCLHQFIPSANSYMTIYIPVKEALRLW